MRVCPGDVMHVTRLSQLCAHRLLASDVVGAFVAVVGVGPTAAAALADDHHDVCCVVVFRSLSPALLALRPSLTIGLGL